MLHLTLRQLQVFDAVARHLSFSRAARELHLTQPAVSMQVRLLEESVGLPLFEQLGKRIYLTEAGREMQQYGQNIATQLREAEAVFEQMKGLEHGELRIAVASTANYFATQLLSRFCQCHPGVEVHLEVSNRADLLLALEQNRIDLVIMGQPPEGYDLEAASFMENPLVLIASPRHALAGRHGLGVEALANETLILREPGSGTRSATERFFQAHGMVPRSGLVMNTNEAIKQAVQADMGLAVVSLHTVTLELQAQQLVVLDVRGFPLRRNWFVVHRRLKRLSPVAQAFKTFLLAEGRQVAQLLQAAGGTGSAG